MAKPIALFDIGATLMGGPDQTPVERLCHALSIDQKDRVAIRKIIYTENIKSPDVLTQRLSDEFPQLNRHAGSHIREIWNSQFNDGYVLSGAWEVLKLFNNAGFRLGIVSNMWYPYFQCFKKLFERQLRNIDVIMLSCEAGCAKPDQRIFQSALERFFPDHRSGFVNPRRICMIGDSFKCDIQPAMDMQFRTVWIFNDPDREYIHLSKAVQRGEQFPDLFIPSIDRLMGDKFKMLQALME